MRVSSQHFVFDNRLLAVEELFQQRKYAIARQELQALQESDFTGKSHEHGLFLALQADSYFNDGNYRKALESGLRSSRILADFPLNRRYGRVLLVLSKTYSALGDLKNAEIKAYDALASYRRANEPIGQIDALNELARIAFIHCDFTSAVSFLEDAIEHAVDEPRKVAQLTGNAGIIRTLCGQWDQAERDLASALEYNEKNDIEVSQARNLLSLGYLHMRRREFVFAERCLGKARKLIDKHNLKRDKVIYLEYAGELALEKADTFKAKSLLSGAYHEGRLLAPGSTLVSQSGRRLAEVELALDNFDEAMKYGQKALEVALQMGEKAEVAMARRVIARVFATRSEHADALDHISKAVETARESNDPLNLAWTLLTLAEIKVTAGSDEAEKIRDTFDEAGRIFKKLGLDYCIAETQFRAGVFACQQGDLSRGFRKLSRAEKVFSNLGATGKVRQVNLFLTSLTDQAVALSISQENEFKIFGNLVNKSDMEDLKSGQIDEVLETLVRRTNSDRAIVFTPDFEDNRVVASFSLTPFQMRKFADNFQQLLGEEISSTRPTLCLDCRRDPYINDLFPDFPDVVASMIVIPFRMSDNSTSYVYLDKLSEDNTLNPFSQAELNFAVGFSDIIAFKSAELQKMRLQEDNRRLKAQLKMEAAFPNILTRNVRMLEVLSQVRQVVDSNISITIEGQTGSGKDLLAKAIHYNSKRRDKRLIFVNCAALPETLLESELFGYHRGAFTGADRDKPGLFEEADGGTFFLDEIADMPLSVQAKILRILEEKEVVRLGESIPRQVDVRIISATNRDLKEQMAAGLFRQDLYYRLSALTFRLPSLRERKEDIPLLVDLFLSESGKKITSAVLKQMIAYDWPGNVRELENEVKKLILLAGDSDEIDVGILSSKILSVPGGQLSTTDFAEQGDNVSFGNGYSLYDFLATYERRFIIKALKQRNCVKKHAAAALNIPESTLRLKIKQYNIDLNHLDSVN